jgi:3-deoxy-D-manno-octulosonic-acid transferase
MVMGPSTFNFAEAADLAEAAGAACRVAGMYEAVAQVLDWLNSPDQRALASAAGPRFASAHQGAAQRSAQAAHQLLR